MDDKIYILDIKPEKKMDEIRRKLKPKLQKGKEWVIKNKDSLIVIAPVVVGGITTIVKVVGKRVNLHKEETLKNLYCYDRSLGHYWKLRRELTNKEWVEIDQRKASGERLADILSELRVLK